MKDYAFPLDAYDLAGLRRQYGSAGSDARVALLERLQKARGIPFEIAILAIEDSDVLIRAWMAKHENLDYHEPYETYDGKFAYRYPDPTRVLGQRVESDPDAYVRACLYQNPTRPSGWESVWPKTSHFEHLAIVRHDYQKDELIMKVFDLSSSELGLTTSEREQLALAFLGERTDREKVRELSERFRQAELESDRLSLHFADTEDVSFGSKLWGLAAGWPPESPVQPLVYEHVKPTADAAAATYRQCNVPKWRQIILGKILEVLADHPGARYREAIRLGMQDADPNCRMLAYEAADFGRGDRWVSPRKTLRKTLRSKDVLALNGLAKNRSLGEKDLRRLLKRLVAINEWEAVDHAKERLQELRVAKGRRLFTAPPDGSLVKWTADQKTDFLATLVLRLTLFWVVLQITGIGSGVGLLVGAVAYLLSHSLTLALFLLVSCTWSAAALSWFWITRWIAATPPWVTTKEHVEQWRVFEDWS